MDKQLRKLLKLQITVKKATAADGRGNVTVESSGTSYCCYIAGEIKVVRDRFGKEVVSSQYLFIDDPEALVLDLQYDDQIIMPDGSTPPILGIIPYYDDRGRLYSIQVNL
jgi:hypothetical protein